MGSLIELQNIYKIYEMGDEGGTGQRWHIPLD